MAADDRTDEVDLKLFGAKFSTDLIRYIFRIVQTIAMADENDLLTGIDGAFLHFLHQHIEGSFTAAGLRYIDEVTLIVHVQHRLDAKHGTDQ